MKLFLLGGVFLLYGCAAGGPTAGSRPLSSEQCTADRVEIARLQAQLAAETAERRRLAGQAARREDALRRQLEAMKSIERGILEREDRMRTETR